MAGGSLLALLDDITTLLDDVAALSKVAAQKTGGVVGDDLALNAEQVTGFRPERELPVIWAVAKGSFVNKLILVPAALVISAFLPRAITPLLMIGGLFLCYEGVEKVLHKLLHAREDDERRTERAAAIADPAVDLVALERDRIKGAIRTDFILSAEIVVIALGTMSSEPMSRQVTALSLIAIAITVLVYGLVAGIVKLDDLGLRLTRAQGDEGSAPLSRALGRGILRAAPLLMKTLSIVGTAAMFLVGGSILVHGLPAVEHALAAVAAALPLPPGLTKLLGDAVVGIVAGALALGVVTLVQRMRGGSGHTADA
jgi:predicted DNA repair protein MutK